MSNAKKLELIGACWLLVLDVATQNRISPNPFAVWAEFNAYNTVKWRRISGHRLA